LWYQARTFHLLGDPDLSLADDVEGVAARPLAHDVLAAVENVLKMTQALKMRCRHLLKINIAKETDKRAGSLQLTTLY
jgi:hypothetical protein